MEWLSNRLNIVLVVSALSHVNVSDQRLIRQGIALNAKVDSKVLSEKLVGVLVLEEDDRKALG